MLSSVWLRTPAPGAEMLQTKENCKEHDYVEQQHFGVRAAALLIGILNFWHD